VHGNDIHCKRSVREREINKVNEMMNHLITNNIVKLMKSIVELGIISGKYIGIYAKDSLDELLLISHQNSSYKGKNREIERTAVSEYIKWLRSHYSVDEDTSKEIEKEINEINEINGVNEVNEINGVNEWKDDFPYEYTEDDLSADGVVKKDVPSGDQFPIYNQYIAHK